MGILFNYTLFSSSLATQADDDVDARDLITFRGRRRLADDHLCTRDIEHLVLAFDEEMMVRCDVRVEIGFLAINSHLPQEPDFGELVQCVVDGRQRYWHFRSRRFFVEHFGCEMAIAFAKKYPTQRHSLAGRAQADFTQHCLHVMPRTASQRRPVRRMSGVSLHWYDRGTRWHHSGYA